MKILFTCVGRRVELVECFRKAAKELNVDLQILATDITTTAPALCFCDKGIIAPRISSDGYIDFLIKICIEEKIDCVIPTIDTDLLILSQNKSRFNQIGVQVVISEPDKIAICRDKRNTARYFTQLGLFSPETVDDVEKYKQEFPAFIKPKDGSSSIDAFKANNFEELKNYAKKIKNYVIQPFSEGVEYTVDVFCDFNAKPIFVTPRKRLFVRAGEVLKTEIHQEQEIINEILRLLDDFKPCGPITVQLIRNEQKGLNQYIEINPRFGGGAPLSIKAGADSAKALISLLMGKVIDYQPMAAQDGAIYSRFDQSVRVK